MNKSFKRVLSLLMTLAMILTALPLAGVTAFAEDGTHTSGDFEYVVLKDGTAEIIYYTGNAKVLEIPSKLNGYTVTSIDDYAFEYCDSLTSVSIPDSITSIGFMTFVFCSSLTEIKVDTNNKNYTSQDGVLFDKNKTELINYPNENERKTYDIPNSVTRIGSYAFSCSENLTSVTIPESVTSIGDEAFEYCKGLTSVTIPKSVTSIGNSAFYDTRYYNNPSNWENGVLYINNCLVDTKSDELPQNYAINQGTRVIADNAFEDCDRLISVTMPDSVTSIGERAFDGCKKLTEINVDASNNYYTSQDGVLFNKNKTNLIDCPEGKTGAYKIPDGVTSIGDMAFYYCDNLTSVTIGNGVTSIGDSAFYYCDNLTSVTIGNGVTSIGDSAFLGCDGLTSITIPNGVKSIGYEAFFICDNLTSVTIGNSVTIIGESAFGGCDSLTEINVDSNNKNYSSQDGVLFNKNKTELIRCPTGKIGAYKIPNSVTSIGYGAFSGSENLTSVTIGNGVTSIGDSAFAGCDGLTSITIPDGVTSIGAYAFANCDSLTSATIGNSVTSIGERAFDDCESLTRVTIPESVTSIGPYAFFYCFSLTEIKVDASNKNYSSQDGVLFNKNKTELIQYPTGNERTSYNIPDSVTSIGDSAFYSCNLTNLKIGNGVKIIGDGAFNSCDSLTSITIPDSVTSIGDGAFNRCYSLTSVTIGNSVTSISEDAFVECYSLTSITIPDSVKYIYECAFYSCTSLTDIYILNKDCHIYPSRFYKTIPTETTIHGYKNSTAESYAKEYGNKFMAINAIGDVDGNTNITITDAKWILQNTVKSRNLTEAQAKAADLNKDGKVTIVDAKWVLQIVVGLRDAQTLKPIKK